MSKKMEEMLILAEEEEHMKEGYNQVSSSQLQDLPSTLLEVNQYY